MKSLKHPTALSDLELAEAEDEAHRNAESSITAAGVIYLATAGPLLVFSLILRAVERSSWSDILWWCGFASVAVMAFARYWSAKQWHARRTAIQEERSKRRSG